MVHNANKLWWMEICPLVVSHSYGIARLPEGNWLNLLKEIVYGSNLGNNGPHRRSITKIHSPLAWIWRKSTPNQSGELVQIVHVVYLGAWTSINSTTCVFYTLGTKRNLVFWGIKKNTERRAVERRLFTTTGSPATSSMSSEDSPNQTSMGQGFQNFQHAVY